MSTTLFSFKNLGLLAAAFVVIAIVAVVIAIPTNLTAYLAAAPAEAIAVAINNGKVTASNKEVTVIITSTPLAKGGSCDYKVSLGDSTQVGPNYNFPCNNDGFEELLDRLGKLGKIREDFLQALREIKMFP